MTSLKTSIKTITYLSDIGCLEIQGASLLMAKRLIEMKRYRGAFVAPRNQWNSLTDIIIIAIIDLSKN